MFLKYYINGGFFISLNRALCGSRHPEWSDDNPLVVVLALVYTTTCGIMVGANLSGDLKDPGKSLPVGTLSAMGTSFVT